MTFGYPTFRFGRRVLTDILLQIPWISPPSFVVGDVPSWLCIFWLRDIIIEFEEIEQERMTYEDEEEIFKAKKKMINDMVLGKEEQLNIITIFGRHRSQEGRKAFAKELYNSPSVINHFDSRACCSLAGDDERSPLLELLGQLVDLSDIICSKNNDELAKLVYAKLEGQRFLLLIDRVRFIEYFGKIRRCFPDSRNGSRILLTTYLRKLAFTTKSKSMLKPQSPQNDKFQESLFQNLSSHAEMMEVGKNIVKRCKPKSMSWVLHLLQTIRKTVNQWEEVANTLGSRVFGLAGSQEDRILELICIYLPDHLRSCFFYLGVLTFSEEVPVLQLIQLWIAEGFVKHKESHSLENTAEDYAENLMARNLLVTKKNIGYKENICCPVGLVRIFLARKVREDNFVKLSKEHYFSRPIVYYHRRLVIRSTWDEFEMLKPYGPFVHSLFCFYRSFIDISIIYNNFKFLRILHLQNTIGDSITKIGVLVLLRYLAVRIFVNFIPPSVANLRNLETLIFEQSDSKVVKVGDFIWDMRKLRHFDVKFSSSFDLEPHRLKNSPSISYNLKSFSKPTLSYGDDMEKLLRKLIGLWELECVFLDSWDDSTKCNRFPVLGFLNQLLSLAVDYGGKGKYPCEFNFPSNLKKLTLSYFQMTWKEISQLAMLNNLEDLVLINNAFEGERWEIEGHVVFPKLKFLGLRYMEVEYWIATHDQFLHLKHLVLEWCTNLVEIPQDFSYISTLRMIELEFCIPSAENSARLIHEQHMKHWGHDELKISCKYCD